MMRNGFMICLVALFASLAASASARKQISDDKGGELLFSAPSAEFAEVRIERQGSNGATRIETRQIPLERISDDFFRFRLAKEDIPTDAYRIEVVPSFMRATVGDDGYWMSGRGTYGRFDRKDGEYAMWRQLMPLMAVKKGDELWYGLITKWRFDYDFVVRAKAGAYEVFPRFRCDGRYEKPVTVDGRTIPPFGYVIVKR